MATRTSRSKTTASKAAAKTDEPKVETPAEEPKVETPEAPAAEETTEAPADETPADEAPEDETPEDTKVPASGALEPPAAPEPKVEDEAAKPITAGEVGAERIKHTHGLIIDATTQAPPNPDKLFVPEAGDAGSVFRCTSRLLQVMNPGDGWSSSQLLVMPRNQLVSQARAEQVAELIRTQIAGAGLDAVDLTADAPKLGDE